MIAQMYGASAQNDVINELVQREFYEVAVAQELKVAGYPRFEGVGFVSVFLSFCVDFGPRQRQYYFAFQIF